MEIKRTKHVAAAVCIFLVFGILAHGASKAPTERSGRVLAATLSGHGPDPEGRTKHSNRLDIWWNYCIFSGDMFYSVLSRETPEKTGLKPEKVVRFSEDRKQLYIVDPRGKRIALRILRKSKDRKCP